MKSKILTYSLTALLSLSVCCVPAFAAEAPEREQKIEQVIPGDSESLRENFVALLLSSGIIDEDTAESIKAFLQEDFSSKVPERKEPLSSEKGPDFKGENMKEMTEGAKPPVPDGEKPEKGPEIKDSEIPPEIPNGQEEKPEGFSEPPKISVPEKAPSFEGGRPAERPGKSPLHETSLLDRLVEEDIITQEQSENILEYIAGISKYL